MRILHFYKTYKPDSQGGVENVISELCKGMATRGIESNVLTVSRNKGTVDFGDHKHFRTHQAFEVASTPFSFSAFSDFKRLAEQADLVHYHFPYPFMDMVHFVTRLRKPTVVTYHSDIVKQAQLLRLYRPLMFNFLDNADQIVATSPNYVETSTTLARYRDKIDVIPLGIDRSTYAPASETTLRQWRQRIGPRFFLFVGNLRYYKGLHHLFNALQNTTFPVVILGGGHLEEELKRQVADLGLTNVHFVGPLPDTDKNALLELCEALIFPSHLRSEAFGISLLEGAMYGKPLLSCEIGTGTSYVNVDGTTGLVVPPADPAAIRQGLQWLWDHPAEAKIMGQNGMRRYEDIFTSEQMISRYETLYLKHALPKAIPR